MLKHRPGARESQEEVVMTDTSKAQEKGAALKTEMDELLDEIDEVLEDNAAAFVKAYHQRGGE